MSVELPEDLFSVLTSGVPALLITVDESGFPHTAFTYAATNKKDSVAIVLDEGSTTEKNIERTNRASVQILAEGNRVYLLKGSVRVEDKLKHSPVPSRRAVVELTSIKNQAWQEIAVAPLTYTFSPQAQTRWAQAVPEIYAELRGE